MEHKRLLTIDDEEAIQVVVKFGITYGGWMGSFIWLVTVKWELRLPNANFPMQFYWM